VTAGLDHKYSLAAVVVRPIELWHGREVSLFGTSNLTLNDASMWPILCHGVVGLKIHKTNQFKLDNSGSRIVVSSSQRLDATHRKRQSEKWLVSEEETYYILCSSVA
jgi:hypothetical protein